MKTKVRCLTGLHFEIVSVHQGSLTSEWIDSVTCHCSSPVLCFPKKISLNTWWGATNEVSALNQSKSVPPWRAFTSIFKCSSQRLLLHLLMCHTEPDRKGWIKEWTVRVDGHSSHSLWLCPLASFQTKESVSTLSLNPVICHLNVSPHVVTTHIHNIPVTYFCFTLGISTLSSSKRTN